MNICRCKSCSTGSVVPRWVNGTMVRPAGDTYPPANYTSAPFPRHDTSDTVYCAGKPPGTCGTWPAGGDYNGLPTQAETDTVDDILACADTDSTHATIDHNCYIKSPVETAGAFTGGRLYQIVTLGSTDWAALGAASDQIKVGGVLTVSGAGSGSGTAQQVVDLRAPKLFGHQVVTASKQFHGSLGFSENDACAKSPLVAPSQAHFLDVDYVVAFEDKNWQTLPASGDHDYDGSEVGSADIVGSVSGGIHVDRTTGLKYNTLVTTWNVTFDAADFIQSDQTLQRYNYTELVISKGAGTLKTYFETALASTETYNSGYSTPMDAIPITDPCYVAGTLKVPSPFFGTDGDGNPNATLASIVESGTYGLTAITDPKNYTGTNSYPSGDGTFSISLSWAITLTGISWSLTATLTDPVVLGYNRLITFTGTITLSNPYDNADWWLDFMKALNAWDMSDPTLAKFREDSKLALAPLVVYDEVGATTPLVGFLPATMDDLNSPVADVNGYAAFTYAYGGTAPFAGWTEGPSTQSANWTPTWAQIPWEDPNSYQWKYPSSASRTAGGFEDCFTTATAYAGAARITGLRDGSIIAHTISGADGHFWFGATTFHRTCYQTDDGSFIWSWNQQITNGNIYPDTDLPTATMRWLANRYAMYDEGAAGEVIIPPGNFPQFWFNQQGNFLIGGKFVQATLKWPSENYGEPCGEMKSAVDQTTVCTINTDATPVYTVKKTGNAIAPLATGGLQAGDYIAVEGYGLCQILTLTATIADSDGNPQWLLTRDTKLDDLTTDFSFQQYGSDTDDGMTHIGRLRFPTAPGICARLAVTPTFDSGSGVVTLTAAGGFTNYRKGIAANVDDLKIYDSTMTTADLTTGLLATISGADITRTDDAVTFTHAAMPTAAFVVVSGYDWRKYDAAPRKKAVKIDWGFDFRKLAAASAVAALIAASDPGAAAAQSAYEAVYGSYPPTWYGGMDGVTSGTVTELDYGTGGGGDSWKNTKPNCPMVIGMVPFTGDPATPVEDFDNQLLCKFPDAPNFDLVFGSHGQSAIYTTMPSAFYQTPFKPDGAGGGFTWAEDDGSGMEDGDVATHRCPDTDSTTTPYEYFAHAQMVEAASELPAGCTLPAGITLAFDSSHTFAPPFYPNGIPIGDYLGNYGSYDRDWAFSAKACLNTSRFVSFYTYVPCT